MDARVLEKQIKSGELPRLYVLYGDEAYLKKRLCRDIIAKALGENEDFNLHRFDAENFDLSQIEAAVNNLPFLSPKKCVVLRDIDPDALRSDEWRKLTGILKALPEECVFIFHFDAVPYSKKSARWKTLLSIAGKTGTAAEIGRLSRSDLARWLVKRAPSCGGHISQAVANYLIDTVGDDMSRLDCELQKLCAYAGQRDIEAKDVEALTVKPLDASIYDLSGAIVSGRLNKALSILDELFYRRQEPVMILSTLSGAFCDLYRAKTAQLSGAGQAQISADFQYHGREFRIRNALRDCRNLSLSYLRGCLDLLMRADRELKSTRAAARTVLERLVVEINSLGGKVGTN